MNDIDWQQADKETIEALSVDLECAYKQIRDLAEVIGAQNAYIAGLKQRFADHGITIQEKSITELTREELVKLNASIPAIRFIKAKNPDKTKMPSYKDQFAAVELEARHNFEEAVSQMITNITTWPGVDLEKHGIDPVTLNFKPGYGPKGPTWIQKIKNYLSKKF